MVQSLRIFLTPKNSIVTLFTDFFTIFMSRQMLDSAVRAHRKQMTSIQSAVSNVETGELVKAQTPPPQHSPELALHKGKRKKYI